MLRRDFLRHAGLLAGTAPALGALAPAIRNQRDRIFVRERRRTFDPTSWSEIRDQFALTRSRIHMASFLLASHPRPVAEAIERHRKGFDEDPSTYWHDHFQSAEPAVREAIGTYLDADPAHIALTDSTTMGLGLVYNGLVLQPGQGILTTPHGHWSTIESLNLCAKRSGAKINSVALYDDPAETSVDMVVRRMRSSITDRTRVLAVTWVHSSTGVKLPISEMADALDDINAGREKEERVLFCVDGVHGLGIEDVTVGELGCDFLMAGTHKWMFGPRGTGLIWGRADAWDALDPIIPTFGPSVGVWIGALPPDTPYITPGTVHTPGGFHSFEHRWAVGEAFQFHLDIGKSRVQTRIHDLNTRTKEALASLPHVRLHTPMSASLSAGIICFDVRGHEPTAVVDHLRRRDIVASTTPYRETYARLAPSLLNTEREIDRTIDAIAELS